MSQANLQLLFDIFDSRFQADLWLTFGGCYTKLRHENIFKRLGGQLQVHLLYSEDDLSISGLSTAREMAHRHTDTSLQTRDSGGGTVKMSHASRND